MILTNSWASTFSIILYLCTRFLMWSSILSHIYCLSISSMCPLHSHDNWNPIHVLTAFLNFTALLISYVRIQRPFSETLHDSTCEINKIVSIYSIAQISNSSYSSCCTQNHWAWLVSWGVVSTDVENLQSEIQHIFGECQHDFFQSFMALIL